MWPNQQFPADLVTLTEEILNGKLHFLCGAGKEFLTHFMPVVSFYTPWKHVFTEYRKRPVAGNGLNGNILTRQNPAFYTLLPCIAVYFRVLKFFQHLMFIAKEL